MQTVNCKTRGNYNATVAKIRAMYGKRMTSEDYFELMNRQNVSEIAEYLKRNTHFGSTLASIDTGSIHRGMLEVLLHRHFYENYMRVIKFEHLQEHEFFNFMLVREEIDEILNCIRHINAKSYNQISDLPIFLNKYTRFDMIELAKVRSYDDLLSMLKHTLYYDLLNDISPDANGRIDYTFTEVKLRTFYINRLLKSLKSFSSKDTEQLELLIKTDVDLINLINAYRMTAFFGEDAATIERDMLHFYGRISEAKEIEIFKSENSEEFLKRYEKTYYGRQIIDAGYDLSNLEISTSWLRYKYMKIALNSAQSAPLSVYSYVFLMNNELRNVITIIEGVRYGIPVKQIESLLII